MSINILIQHAVNVDENGETEYLLLQKPELTTFFQSCKELEIECKLISMTDMVKGKVQTSMSRTYLWASCMLHKIAPYPLSSIQWNLYTPLVLHRCCTHDDTYYVNNTQLKDVLFSPFCDVAGICGTQSNTDDAKIDENVYFSKPLLADKMFFAKTGTLVELEKELIRGYNAECACFEYDQRFFYVTGLCENKPDFAGEEVRNIVLDGNVVSSCTYATDAGCMESDQYLNYRHSIDSMQWQQAQALLDRSPRLIEFFDLANQSYFVLDTVFDKRDEKWKMLELNPFWSSAIYGGDIKPLLEYLIKQHL